MTPSPLAGDRRGSKRALAPLVVMAAAFFIPSYRACSDEPLRSAAQFATDGWDGAVWVVPVFLCAAIFATLTAFALRRGDVTRTVRKVGLGTLALLSLASLGSGAWAAKGDDEWQWLAVALLTTTAAGALVRRARGREPWQVWEHLLGAFTVLAASAVPTILLAGDLVGGGSHSGPGAWLFIGAQVALWAVLGHALVRARLGAVGQALRR